jgi:transglutaminase-like putative cysteine protease
VHFRVEHETLYSYDAPVMLGAHVLRLTPRPDGVRLRSHRLEISPEPAKRSEDVDAFGNRIALVEFAEAATQSLRVTSTFELDTLPPPSLDLSLDPLPWPAIPDAPAAYCSDSSDASVREFAERLAAEADRQPVGFLDRLSREVCARIDLRIRPTGDARPAHETLALGHGACRDMTVLFLQACHCLGLPGRFVSGYQAHADTADGRRHLHAWAEVLLPGARWRGWDVTHGTRVADGHVVLCSAPTQAATMPIEGSYTLQGNSVRSTLDYRVHIDAA